MKYIYTICLIFISIMLAQDFHEGPYGNHYFDIAGPFNIEDLNSDNELLGDVNSDLTLNIQDVMIIVGVILQTIDPDEEIENLADINQDDSVNVQDITLLLERILYPESYIPENHWDFETEWNGEESYMFIHYEPGNNNSMTMWDSDRAGLLEKSPMNVHYFFISNSTNPEQAILSIKMSFDALISGMNEDMQIHWKNHLHFIPTKTSELNNWLIEALNGNYAISIDRLQRIRQAGYLGNPNGFSGFYMSYLAHEAIYYNYEWDVFNEDPTTYDEITVFEKEHYTGGWASTILQLVEFPSDEDLDNYNGMAIELLRGCPDAN